MIQFQEGWGAHVCSLWCNSLTHAVDKRPKFRDLVEHEFIKYIEKQEVDVETWYANIIAKEEAL